MDERPIGFFDSGMGGVSVLRAAMRELPNECYLYYGDNLHAPYGDKSEQEITRLTLAAADELVRHNIKALVIACNTATATCIRSSIWAACDVCWLWEWTQCANQSCVLRLLRQLEVRCL